MKKKKAVAAILLLLCCGMLILIGYQKLVAPRSSGGGGGGGGGGMPADIAPAPDQQADGAEAEQTPPLEPMPMPEKSGRGHGTLVTPSTPDGSDSISWDSYDMNRILYSGQKLILTDASGKETSHELAAEVTSVTFKELGLKENQRYIYKVIPVDGGRDLSDKAEDAGMKVVEGSFDVNLEDEAPTAPVITAPVKGQTVATLNPEITWEPSRDNDPGEQGKLQYEVKVKESGSGNIVDQKTLSGQSYQVGSGLTENKSYVVTVSAKDPDGMTSGESKVSFRVDASKEAPSRPSRLYVKNEAAKKSHRLTWDKSVDPNPNGRVDHYVVAIADAATKRTLGPTKKTKWTSYPYTNGVYGQEYVFRVKAVSSSGTPSAWSSWSAPFKFEYQYVYVPQLTNPAQDGQKLTIADTLVWEGGPDLKEFTVTVNNGTLVVPAETTQISMARLKEEGLIENGGQYNVQVSATRQNGEQTGNSPKIMFVYANTPPTPPAKIVMLRDEGSWQRHRKLDVLGWTGATDADNDGLTYTVTFTPVTDKQGVEPVTVETKAVQLPIKDVYDELDDTNADVFMITIVSKDGKARSELSQPLKYVYDD